MQNKFCNRCGQANFPNAASCSKCGASLAQGNLGAAQGDNPPPTVMPQKFSSKPEKKSNAMLWIVGGLVGVVLVVVGIAVIAAAGIFIYTATGDEPEREYPAPERKAPEKEPDDQRPQDDRRTSSDNPLDDVTFPSGDDITFGDGSSGTMNDKVLLNFFLQKKARVGNFRLVEVKTSTDKSTFATRTAGAQAEYRNGRKRLLHRVAIYRSLNDARNDIDAYRQSVRRSGARIRVNKRDQLVFASKGVVYFSFYNPQGGLHEISARNGKDILRYYRNYFK